MTIAVEPTPSTPTMQFQQPPKSSCADLPRLASPTSAVVEAEQQFFKDTVRLPMRKQRDGPSVKAHFPSSAKTTLAFTYAYEGFCGARRLMSMADRCIAERSLIAENMELAAHITGVVPPDNSLAPRGVCVSLAIPEEMSGGKTSFSLFDGFAQLSDKKTKDSLPVTLSARFSAYAGTAASLLQSSAVKNSWTSTATSPGTAMLVLRWPQRDPSAEYTIRAEFVDLSDAHSTLPGDMGSYLQQKLLSLALRHRVTLPATLYSITPPTPVAFAERQVATCCAEFKNLVERTSRFEPTPLMLHAAEEKGTDCVEKLSEVSGVYLRLVPHSQGASGLSSPDRMHAMLLAGVEHETQARQFVAANTQNGVLVPPDEQTAKRLLLHTVATEVQPLCLSGMVTLYGALGKPGAPIRSPGTLIRTVSTKIVEIGHVCSAFALHVCGLESLFPVEPSLMPFAEAHMRRCVDYCNHAFRGGAPPLLMMQPPEQPIPLNEAPSGVHEASKANSFLLSALGVRLDCPKTLLGDALHHLREANAPPVIIDLLTCVAAGRGCAVSMQEAFATCLQALQSDATAAQKQRSELARLKTIADAALAMMTMKRPPPPIGPVVDPKKVTTLLRGLCLKAGRRVSRFSGSLKSSDVAARSLASSIYAAYAKNDNPSTPHLEEVISALLVRDDIIQSVAFGFRVCMISPGKARDAFILSLDLEAMHFWRVLPDGSAENCKLSDCFEARDPRILSLKFKTPNTVIATPLVRSYTRAD